MQTEITAGFWLSPEQKCVWVHQQERSPATAVALTFLEGPLDENRFREALRSVSRHEVLRTVFRHAPGMKFPLQLVLENAEPLWLTSDLSGWDKGMQTRELERAFCFEQSRRFNVDAGPVFGGSLYRLTPQKFALVLSASALCCDSRSLRALIDEIGLVYAGREIELSIEPLRYFQFAQWQNDLMESDDADAQNGKSFWNTLWADNIPSLSLPEVSGVEEGFEPQTVCREIDPSLLSRMEALANGQGTQVSACILAAWQCLL